MSHSKIDIYCNASCEHLPWHLYRACIILQEVCRAKQTRLRVSATFVRAHCTLQHNIIRLLSNIYHTIPLYSNILITNVCVNSAIGLISNLHYWGYACYMPPPSRAWPRDSKIIHVCSSQHLARFQTCMEVKLTSMSSSSRLWFNREVRECNRLPGVREHLNKASLFLWLLASRHHALCDA